MIRKLFCLLAAIACLAAAVLPGFALVQPELMLDSQAAIVLCAETGQVLYAKNPDEVLYPASITKILTGMVALKYGEPDSIITFSKRAYRSVPRDSAHIALEAGETLSLKDALYALALVSANDAAAGIAETVGGSLEGFAELMNREAQACGAVNSHFNNPHGLPDTNHYTTARDMALITKAAIATPGFLEIFSTLDYTMAPTNKKEEMPLTSKNRFTDGLLDCPGLLFSKTGWTLAAQGTLVTAARREGITLIAVVMKSEKLEQKYSDTQALLDYAYGSFLASNLTSADATRLLREQGLAQDVQCTDFSYFPVLVPVMSWPAELKLLPLADTKALKEGDTLPVLVSAADESGEDVFLLETSLPLIAAEIPPETQPPETQPPETMPPETEPVEVQPERPPEIPGWIIFSGLAVSVYLISVLAYISFRKR